MNNPPLLRTLACDPILSNVKLIAEAWDAGGLYQVGSFPASHRWAEWNGRYRDALRGFLKGDCWQSWDAAWSISGSGDLYGGYYGSATNGNYAGYNSCVNFLTCHDGFTLYDLYSYNEKHNEANGWNNTDGSERQPKLELRCRKGKPTTRMYSCFALPHDPQCLCGASVQPRNANVPLPVMNLAAQNLETTTATARTMKSPG